MNETIKRTYKTESGRKIRMVYFHRTVQEFIFRAIFYGFSRVEIRGRYIVLIKSESDNFPAVGLKIDIESDYKHVESMYFNPVVEISKKSRASAKTSNWSFEIALKMDKINLEEII